MSVRVRNGGEGMAKRWRLRMNDVWERGSGGGMMVKGSILMIENSSNSNVMHTTAK